MSETAFNTNDAHNNLKNIDDEQAQQWVRIANDDFVRRMSIDGATEAQCKQFASKFANQKLIGKRPYEAQ